MFNICLSLLAKSVGLDAATLLKLNPLTAIVLRIA